MNCVGYICMVFMWLHKEFKHFFHSFLIRLQGGHDSERMVNALKFESPSYIFLKGSFVSSI